MKQAQQKLQLRFMRMHPAIPIRSFELVGEGLDHIAVEVNGDLIVRFAKAPGGKEAIEKEVELLRILAPIDLVKIPTPIAELRGNDHYSYSKIAGVPLILVLEQIKAEELSAICRTLGKFLSELHSIPVTVAERLVPVEDDSFDDLLEEARDTFHLVKDLIPKKTCDGVQEFLCSASPTRSVGRSLIHNDLGVEHLIVKPGLPNHFGVIDWSDSAIGDPALDFSRIYRDLGIERLKEMLDEYQPKIESVEEIFERILFHARCSIFEELAYGRQAGHEIYLFRAKKALQVLFPT